LKRDDTAADKIVAIALKLGAYSAFGLIIVGLLLQPVTRTSNKITVAGLLVLLATPALRIAVAGIQFFRERDWPYVWVSVGILAIVALAYTLGIQT